MVSGPKIQVGLLDLAVDQADGARQECSSTDALRTYTREREQGKTVLLLSMALIASVSKKMSASKQIRKANTLLQTLSR